MVAELLWLELVWIVDWWAGVKVVFLFFFISLKFIAFFKSLVIYYNCKSDYSPVIKSAVSSLDTLKCNKQIIG